MASNNSNNSIIVAALNHLSKSVEAGEDLSYLTKIMNIDLDSLDQLPIEKLIKEFEPKLSYTVDEMFKQKSIKFEQSKELEDSLKWIISENGDNTDIEYEVTYLEATTSKERVSLNILFCFEWDTNNFYMVIGNNEGEGFNTLFGVHDFSNLNLVDALNGEVKRLNGSPTKALLNGQKQGLSIINQHPLAFETLVTEGVRKLENWLKK